MENGEKVWPLKPETFMNLSGKAVRQVVDFFQADLDNLLVVCDDFNLPLGKLRFRRQGNSRRAQRPARHTEPPGDNRVLPPANRRGRPG